MHLYLQCASTASRSRLSDLSRVKPVAVPQLPPNSLPDGIKGDEPGTASLGRSSSSPPHLQVSDPYFFPFLSLAFFHFLTVLYDRETYLNHDLDSHLSGPRARECYDQNRSADSCRDDSPYVGDDSLLGPYGRHAGGRCMVRSVRERYVASSWPNGQSLTSNDMLQRVT